MKFTNANFGEDVYTEVLSHSADQNVNCHVRWER